MKKHIFVVYPLLMASAYVYAQKPTDAKPEEAPMTTKNTKETTSTSTRQKTISGRVEYEILQEGKGAAAPQKGDKVSVHYTGWLSDNGQPGRKFDSSIDRKKPFEFTLGIGQVIRGWDEGVLGMKIGEKRRLYIPSSEGYGARGVGVTIPPHSDLIFDVQLIEIIK